MPFDTALKSLLDLVLIKPISQAAIPVIFCIQLLAAIFLKLAARVSSEISCLLCSCWYCFGTANFWDYV